MKDFSKEQPHRADVSSEADTEEKEGQKDLDALQDILNATVTKEPTKAQKSWLPGFRALREASGEAGLLKIFMHNIFKKKEADFLFKNFSREGWESVKEIFGEERAKKELFGYGMKDVFAFSKRGWHELIEALGESEPYDSLWDSVIYAPCVREWIQSANLIKERKAFMTEEEFKAVYAARSAASVLVHDGRKSGWLRTEPDAKPDLEKYPVITETKWNDWRNFWGKDWISFLKFEPDSEILERMTPQTFETLFGKIPSWKERLITDPSASDIVRHLSDWGVEGDVQEFASAFESLGEAETDFFKERTMREIIHYVSWHSHWYGKDVMRAMKEVSSPEYAKKTFKETVPFFDSGGDFTRAQYPRTGVSEERVYEEYKKTFRLREKIDGVLDGDGEVAKAVKEFPEFLPWLRMRYADALDRKLSPEFALKDTKAFLEKLEASASGGFDERVVPSVGVEIEVMTKNLFQKRRLEEYVRTALFGVEESGSDQEWEFALEPTSAGVHARFIAELIKEGWIDKKYLGDNNYSLHVNIGIPEGLEPDPRSVAVMTLALVAAYTNPKRIESGEYGNFFTIQDREAVEFDRAQRYEVGGQQYSGRVELRALALDRRNMFRTLYDSAMLSAALYAGSRKEPRDVRDKDLATLWIGFQADMEQAFKTNGIDFTKEYIDRGDEVGMKKIIGMQKEAETLVKELSQKVRKLVRKPFHPEKTAVGA
ncbi:MAG: hypothetical protein A3H69_04140 [Candidatus Sungbacteria bacterium RIFCSPLOWO2_02_FULL_47_9]|nr:MAG: hypothetical protein A3H69_04140 [Candidatus Sungbacteria bacterium RIFCSPLOWO2_02_FULL_47_9]